MVSNAHQEFNQMCFGTITPSKITTKRRHIFLSPNNKKRQYCCEKKSGKDQPQFQRVGRICAKKKSMEDKLERSSRRYSIVEQPSPAHNIGMDIWYYVMVYMKYNTWLSWISTNKYFILNCCSRDIFSKTKEHGACIWFSATFSYTQHWYGNLIFCFVLH